MKRLMKSMSEALLGRYGYRIADERNIHDEPGLIRRLKSANFKPKTVIDVGVAHGTPYLYEGFSEARFLLFDPTKESLPYMEDWSKRINASVYNFGLGAEPSKMKVRVRDTIQHSTFLQDISHPTLACTYEVEIKRFDDLKITLSAPCLAKIDVEGFELEVLKGMTGQIQEIDLFLIETSLISLYEGGIDAIEVINFMHDSGFRTVDIAGITRRPSDSLIQQIDYVFARNGTKLAAKRWE